MKTPYSRFRKIVRSVGEIERDLKIIGDRRFRSGTNVPRRLFALAVKLGSAAEFERSTQHFRELGEAQVAFNKETQQREWLADAFGPIPTMADWSKLVVAAGGGPARHVVFTEKKMRIRKDFAMTMAVLRGQTFKSVGQNYGVSVGSCRDRVVKTLIRSIQEDIKPVHKPNQLRDPGTYGMAGVEVYRHDRKYWLKRLSYLAKVVGIPFYIEREL